jgi:sulfite reductase alpha subunit-like flavoprotein
MSMVICFQTYVQDLVKKNASEIYDMLVNKGGHFFVCGDVSMADDVHTSLEVSFTSFENLFVG